MGGSSPYPSKLYPLLAEEVTESFNLRRPYTSRKLNQTIQVFIKYLVFSDDEVEVSGDDHPATSIRTALPEFNQQLSQSGKIKLPRLCTSNSADTLGHNVARTAVGMHCARFIEDEFLRELVEEVEKRGCRKAFDVG